MADTEPEKFENIQYLTELNKELQSMYSYLLVCEDDRIIYYGCEDYPSELVKKLAKVQEFTTSASDGMYLGGKVQALVKEWIFIQKRYRKEMYLLFPTF